MIKIGWIDFSTDDRNKAKQLLTLIKPEGQLDELGIGYIRDAISNKLFPGISTIQTRAKYFFIVPYILRDYMALSAVEKRKTTPTNYLKKEEDNVQDYFREKFQATTEKGIIGFTMGRGRYVKRKPSEIYANGLSTFKFMDYYGSSLNTVLQNAQRQNRYIIETAQSDDAQDDQDVSKEETFKITVPYKRNWKNELNIRLTEAEANFFKQRIQEKSNIKLRNSLLAELFENEEILKMFLELDFYNFAYNVKGFDINLELKKVLTIGFDFNYVVEGSHLLYNHLLQKHFFTDYQDEFLDDFNNWLDNLETAMISFENFDMNFLFSLSGNRNYRQTEFFLMQWWKSVLKYKQTRDSETLVELLNLIRKREQSVKVGKARLRKSPQNNPDVKNGKRIGIDGMNFRYQNAKVIVQDILNPIQEI